MGGSLKRIPKNRDELGDGFEPAAIRLTSDRKELAATGEDLCCILVEALDESRPSKTGRDEKGTLCSLADNLIRFDVEGPAEIADVGNGSPFRLNHFRRTAEGCFTAR
ncbi:MAG: hypothetical protein ACETWQ_20670 [Phycisphaerae bacterium]